MIFLENVAGLSPAIIFDLGIMIFVLMIVAQYMKWPFLKFVSLIFFPPVVLLALASPSFSFPLA